MKLNRTIAAALFALLFVATASAQIGIYAGFSGAHLYSASGNYTTVYGPLVGAYAQTGRFLAIGADVRGSFLTHNGSQFYTGAIGPRIAFKPVVLPIKPYVEGLIGFASYNGGNSSPNTNYVNYQILGGIDTTILPRIDWRILEFDYSAIYNNSINAKTLTTGLVFRLP